MPFLRRILLAALCAGVLSGIFAALLHQLATVPLILEAEKYEQASEHPAAHPSEHAPPDPAPASLAAAAEPQHSHDDAWAPEAGIERAAYTLVADLLAGIGFALL